MLSPFRHLEKFRETPDGFIACCPVHEEKTPSFRGKVKNGKLVVHCHGCHAKTDDIRKALGLPWSAFFANSRLSSGEEARKRRREATEREELAIWRDSEMAKAARELSSRDTLLRSATKWSQVLTANDGYAHWEMRWQILWRGKPEAWRLLRENADPLDEALLMELICG